METLYYFFFFFSVLLTFYVCTFVQVSHGKSSAAHVPEIAEPLGFLSDWFLSICFLDCTILGLELFKAFINQLMIR